MQIVAAVPGHPVLRQALNKFVRNAANLKVDSDTTFPDSLTGPGKSTLDIFITAKLSARMTKQYTYVAGFWTDVVLSALGAESQSALETYHSSWERTSEIAKARKSLDVCLMGRSMFQDQCVKHLFASRSFNSTSYPSWVKDAYKYIGE